MVSGKIIHAIPKSWKKDIKTDQGKRRNLLYLNHSLSISLRNTVSRYLTKIF